MDRTIAEIEKLQERAEKEGGNLQINDSRVLLNRIKEYESDRSRLACEMSRLREQHHNDCKKIMELEGKVKVLNGINTTLSEGLGNAVEDYIKVEAKNKELVTSRDYWARVCKEAQEQRDLNAIWLERAEVRNKALVEGIKVVIPCLEDWIATTGFGAVNRRDREALALIKKLLEE